MRFEEHLIVSHRYTATLLLAICVALFLLLTNDVMAHGTIPAGGKKQAVSIGVAAISVAGKGVGGAALSNLIDGNGNTKWMTRLPQDFVLDLGISHKVDSVRIAIAAHRKIWQHRFSVAVSLDGTSWMRVVNNRRLGKSRVSRAGFSAINARYVRISLNGISHKDTLTLRGFEVYGPPPSRSPGLRGTGGPASHQITLKWSPSSGHVNGYLVYYGPTASQASAQISDLSVSSPGFNPQAPSVKFDTWRDLNAQPGDNICFRIRAYGATGLSAWSSAVCSGV